MTRNDDISEDIDALITQLNASTTGGKAVDGALRIESLLEHVVEHRGSDLLLVANSPPAMRVDGGIVRLPGAMLSGYDIEEAVVPLLPSHAKRQYESSGVADASLRLQALGRFRVNLHRERGQAAAAIRVLPRHVPQALRACRCRRRSRPCRR